MTSIEKKHLAALVVAMMMLPVAGGAAENSEQAYARPASHVVILPAQVAKTVNNALEEWPAGKSPAEIGRRISERFLATPYINYSKFEKPTYITYPEVCTWYGALKFSQLTKDDKHKAALLSRFDPLLGPEARMVPPVLNVDYAVFGALPLEIARQTQDTRARELGLKIAKEQWAKPDFQQLARIKPEQRVVAEQAVSKGLSWHTRYWIDDMFMITLLQVQAYRVTHDPVYLNRAASEMIAYLERLQRPNGLFFHAPDVPWYWGRGNGWFAAGMTELLLEMPVEHPLRSRVMQGYTTMMASLLKYQSADGMWRQLIDVPESWPETSCTAMFSFAFITGVKKGWLDKTLYAPAARRAWLALTDYIDQAGNVRDVCEGTDKKNDRQYYLDRRRITGDLHGQAPVLWCANAWLEDDGGGL